MCDKHHHVALCLPNRQPVVAPLAGLYPMCFADVQSATALSADRVSLVATLCLFGYAFSLRSGGGCLRLRARIFCAVGLWLRRA